MIKSQSDVTRLLRRITGGDDEAMQKLAATVYPHLKRIAAKKLQAERGNHTLQPTALVNEVFARLLSGKKVEWNDRTHFFSIAARIMRYVLIDHANMRRAQRRGQDPLLVSLVEDRHGQASDENAGWDLLVLNDVLEKLAKANARQAQIIELRWFGGLTVEEIAEAIACSTSTIKRELLKAQIWLHRELGSQGQAPSKLKVAR